MFIVYTQQYCQVEFLFKLFVKMWNKREFLKIFNLYDTLISKTLWFGLSGITKYKTIKKWPLVKTNFYCEFFWYVVKFEKTHSVEWCKKKAPNESCLGLISCKSHWTMQQLCSVLRYQCKFLWFFILKKKRV